MLCSFCLSPWLSFIVSIYSGLVPLSSGPNPLFTAFLPDRLREVADFLKFFGRHRGSLAVGPAVI
jgi:hypothetical protein